MKLAGHAATRFCSAPDLDRTGVLLHGSDPGMILQRRRELVATVLQGDEDAIRLTQIEGSEVRRDADALWTALRTRGFFPGRQIVLITGATDALTNSLATALDGATPEDALLVATAGLLPARSSLRKLFEAGDHLASLQFFDDALGAQEIASELARRGADCGVSTEALETLAAIAESMDHGSFAQLLEILAIFSMKRGHEIGAADVALLAHAGPDADISRFVDAVANGETAALGPLLQRLVASNATPVSLLIAMQRHFRMLLRIAAADTGPDAAIQQIRPPLWGDRRRVVLSQARKWDRTRLAHANRLLFEVDGRVRSSMRTPDLAVVERCALRLSLMGGR